MGQAAGDGKPVTWGIIMFNRLGREGGRNVGGEGKSGALSLVYLLGGA